jgi:hypothetical protein
VHHLTVSSPAHYRVTVVGSLDENWSSRIGMQVKVHRDVDNNPITTLMGVVIDQGMLLGVLNYVYDLGMPILKVEWMNSDAV